MEYGYVCGLYMRLSRDDGCTESTGIESQRLLLREAAEAQNIKIYKEYIDDGYSGTSLERPAFSELLADIDMGKINTVMVKDMSRLGRNYIAAGELTEVYFPEHRVRLISVNDGYDSLNGEDDMTPFRHVINEMYARDISKKIRTALYAKMRDGQYIGSFPPYGYKKSEENKNRLEIDIEAARVVVRIFKMRVEGMATRDIAGILNEEKIPVPLDYRRGEYIHKWTQSGICKILRNRVYLGHTVQGKSIKPTMKSRRSYSRARETWIVVENTHEPIIDTALFELVNRK